MPILEARKLRKRYGSVVALEDADFTLEAGEVHVLIGTNGCGKSTLCKIIAGSVGADSGELRIDGVPHRFRSPRDAAAVGVSVFYQELSLVPTMTVAENLFLGREPTRGGLVDKGRLSRMAAQAVERFKAVLGPGFRLDAPVAELSADQRQIVEILKVIGENGRIVVFDEPTSSLDRAQVALFFDIVRALKAEGRAIVFISHRMDEIFAIGDRVTVMRNGRTAEVRAVAETTPGEIVRLMVGEDLAQAAPRRADAPDGPVALEVEGLSGPRFADVSFTLRGGEILGFGGLHGQGQSAVLRGLFRAGPVQSGRVRLFGRPVALRSPRDALHVGLAYISGDRGRDGVAVIRPIVENLSLSLLARERRGLFSPAAMATRLRPLVERLKLRFGGFGLPVGSLSGGNQQKVVIGRWLAVAPRVILFDDPTKGIDVGAKADFYAILRELAAEGAAIVLYSSEDMEIIDNADRVLVFNGGRIVRELVGPAITKESLYEAAYAAGDAA